MYITRMFSTAALLASVIWASHGRAAEYEKYRQPLLDKPAITQADILPLIERLNGSPLLKVQQLGKSFEGRPIYKLSLGEGETRILLWSQMHGDEPTATAALFDLLNFISAPEQADWRDEWLSRVQLVMVPMLNPDGAERNRRRNAQGFDINRDAISLQSPEGRALMSLARAYKPHFGFNLHDQNRFYGVGDSGKMATISVLAPPYNTAREVNESRRRAMQLIAALAPVVESFTPGHLAKYDDTYAVRAFGDTFSEMGISTVLIESGAHPQDDNRQIARELNFRMLLSAIEAIGTGSYLKADPTDYDRIPFNRDDAIVDLKLSGVRVQSEGSEYLTDLAINQHGDRAGMVDVGDLSNLSGAMNVGLEDWVYSKPKAYELPEGEVLVLDDALYRSLISQGFGYFTGDESNLKVTTSLPVVLNPAHVQSDTPLRRRGSTFILKVGDQVVAAVLQGTYVELPSAAGALVGSR
ncbi:M14 metallopeptidase family protein [Microbulbifer elongatus]|uniref:M14 family metallopeptidase n=1 Tax=Microbulbifer elongatus TaxID=86173 RepID=UPI001CFCD5C6|nr:M14 metallopeptidase family protein [Microbulbifer elongatus]